VIEHLSEHFSITCLPDAPAAQHLAEVASRLEIAWTALASVLAYSAPTPDRNTVHLAETLDADYRLRDGAIVAVYRSDAPAVQLERAVAELVLSRIAGTPRSPRFLIDGLLGAATAAEVANSTVREHVRQGGSVALAAAISERSTTTPPTNQIDIAASFTLYLLRQYDARHVADLARALNPEEPDIAFMAVFGAPLASLQTAWLANLAGVERGVMGMRGFLRWAGGYLRPYAPQVVLISLLLVVVAAFNVVLPLSLRFLIDFAILPGNYSLLVAILAVLVALFLLQAIAEMAGGYLATVVGTRMMNDVRARLFGHLQRLSMDYYARAQAGDIVSRFSSDLVTPELTVTRILPILFAVLIGLVGSIALLFALDWRLAVLTVLTLLTFVIGPALLGPRTSRASFARQEDAGRVASIVQETVGAQATVKAFGLEPFVRQRLADQLRRLARSTTRVSFLGSLTASTAELSMTFTQVVSLGVGAVLVMIGEFSVGGLVAFQGLVNNVVLPLRELSQIVQMLQQAAAGVQRVEDVLAEVPLVVDGANAAVLPRLQREVRLDNATFGYSSGQNILQEVSVAIPAGAHVAVVGPSGCGKSTLFNLVLRFYDPSQGSVTIDGLDVRRVTQASLRDQMGTVFQDSVLFDATVRENIRLGKTSASDAEVEAAARAAEVHDAILALPDGYDTQVAERGARLSGGQRQRVALARALVRQPALLLLDEATSALDAETEAAINATLSRLRGGLTVVAVTHRLASVVSCDVIFVLDRGRIVQQGKHEDLLAQTGLYRRLWEQQRGAERDPRANAEDALRSMPYFQGLDGTLLQTLATQFVTERFEAGEIVFHEGDPGDRFYVVVRGQLDVIMTVPFGRERRLVTLNDGNYFGEIALLQEVPRTATVRARTPTMCLTLERQQFLDLVAASPELRAAFEQSVAARRAADNAGAKMQPRSVATG